MIAILVGKTEKHQKKEIMQGYIAMIAVDNKLRGQKIGSRLVDRFEADAKLKDSIQSLVLDTECINTAALSLYTCKLKSVGFLQGEKI